MSYAKKNFARHAGSANRRSPTTRRANAPRRRRARKAQHPVWHRPQPRGRNRVAASVTRSVGTVGELGQRSLGTGQEALQRVSHADLRQAADRLSRPVADPLAEALRASELGTLGERRHALARVVSTGFEGAADRIEVQRVEGRGHASVLPGLAEAMSWSEPPTRSIAHDPRGAVTFPACIEVVGWGWSSGALARQR